MINWNQISLGDILTFAAILLAAIGLWLNLLRMRKSIIQKSAEYIIHLYNQYVSDPDMMDIYYKIEYNSFQYNSNFSQSQDERKLDKLLGLAENIAQLYVMKNITKKDLKFVAYEMLTIYQNQEVQKYISFLDEWYEMRGIKNTPFEALRQVATVLEMEMML